MDDLLKQFENEEFAIAALIVSLSVGYFLVSRSEKLAESG